MKIKIALAGNPNCGKTTLFNALTGSNQFVGNWPGVTVEKKEGKLKKHDDVVITDLPGIYSLSPYTLEEVVARNYLIQERPEAILNIIDGTNLERNLYLTTQLVELGIPVVVAVNMMDVVNKNGDKIDTNALGKALGCKVVEISALKGTGIEEAAEAAIHAAQNTKTVPQHSFSGVVEHAIAHIEEVAVHTLPEEQQRFFAIKIFERDEKIIEQLGLTQDNRKHIETDIEAAEKELDDDAESIITNERYVYIASIIKQCYKKKNNGGLTVSDKIDKVVTNRILALPIFAVVMFIVYYISVTTVGTVATDWANDGVFGDGWHLFGIGAGEYEDVSGEFGDAANVIDAFVTAEGADDVADAIDTESDTFDAAAAASALDTFAASVSDDATADYTLVDEETLAEENVTYTGAELKEAVATYASYGCEEPDPADYGVWVPGLPGIIESGLDAVNCADWLKGLILDGIVAGVGAVLGFVPQMLVLFIFLAFLESCGYMARIAFVMDRIFRKFGLSGKSFIPILIGTGCGVPGIMASRTIESESARRLTVMTTTFMPCSAKLPIIALIATAIFGGVWWVAPLAYFMGIAAIIISGIILRKTRPFMGKVTPYVMELPEYRLPRFVDLLRSMWDRAWAFIKKAGTIILLATIVVWFLSGYGIYEGKFMWVGEDLMDYSFLAYFGNAFAWIFAPLGFNNWECASTVITGLIAKENVISTMAVVYGGDPNVAWTSAYMASLAATTGSALLVPVAAFAFMTFQLLCAPCFAAIGAIKREMNNAKWTWFAIGYQCVFAYVIALMINQFGGLFTGNANILGVIVAVLLLAGIIYMLCKPYKEATKLSVK